MLTGLPGLVLICIAFWLAVAGSWWSSARLAGAAAVIAIAGLVLLYLAEPSKPIR